MVGEDTILLQPVLDQGFETIGTFCPWPHSSHFCTADQKASLHGHDLVAGNKPDANCKGIDKGEY